MIIDQVIQLKKETGIVEEDATYKNQMKWYCYAFKEGLIETVVENGRLLGFIEWVRGYLENNLFIAPPKTIKTAPILWITNCVAMNAGIIWKLREKVANKNKDRKATCWHNKSRKRWVIIRRKHA